MFCQKCGKEVTGNFCENCGTAVNTSHPMSQPTTQTEVQPPVQQPYAPQATPPELPKKVKKPIYKKWWFWVIIVFVLIIVIASFGGGDDADVYASASTSKNAVTQSADTTNDRAKVTVVDFSAMSKTEIEKWAETNNVRCVVTTIYSDTVPEGNLIDQSEQANSTVSEGDIIYVKFSKGKKPSVEFENALYKAKSYSDNMHMSKQGIYDQLVSEYGENFSAEAAQYAVDHLDADYKANALAKAKSYQQNMHMSTNAIYEQLISEYGEQFTKEEAQYAIDHLND